MSRPAAEHREQCLRFAVRNKRPFTIEQEDTKELPGLLDRLPTVREPVEGWILTSQLALNILPVGWRQFIIPGLGYAILDPDKTHIGRFRQNPFREYRGLGKK